MKIGMRIIHTMLIETIVHVNIPSPYFLYFTTYGENFTNLTMTILIGS